MLADALGRPVRGCITLGQASDIASASDLLDGQQAGAVLPTGRMTATRCATRSRPWGPMR